MPYIAWLTRAFRVHYAHKLSTRISRMISRGSIHREHTQDAHLLAPTRSGVMAERRHCPALQGALDDPRRTI
jgi:hypothetical protein